MNELIHMSYNSQILKFISVFFTILSLTNKTLDDLGFL